MQRSALCRSRRGLSNEYLLATIGVDTAENEPLVVWGENSIQYSIVSLLATAAFERQKIEGASLPEELEALRCRRFKHNLAAHKCSADAAPEVY